MTSLTCNRFVASATTLALVCIPIAMLTKGEAVGTAHSKKPVTSITRTATGNGQLKHHEYRDVMQAALHNVYQQIKNGSKTYTMHDVALAYYSTYQELDSPESNGTTNNALTDPPDDLCNYSGRWPPVGSIQYNSCKLEVNTGSESPYAPWGDVYPLLLAIRNHRINKHVKVKVKLERGGTKSVVIDTDAYSDVLAGPTDAYIGQDNGTDPKNWQERTGVALQDILFVRDEVQNDWAHLPSYPKDIPRENDEIYAWLSNMIPNDPPPPGQ